MPAHPRRIPDALSRAMAVLSAFALVLSACSAELSVTRPTVPAAAGSLATSPTAVGTAVAATASVIGAPGPNAATSPGASARAPGSPATATPASVGAPPGAAAATPIAGPTPASTATPSTRLAIGDGKISTAPARGSLFLCPRPGGGGGAQATGPWFGADGTFDPTLKPIVSGQISWQSQLQVTVSGTSRLINGNGLPNHATGSYPVSPNDLAYQYDRNPNSIRSYSVALTLPAVPTAAAMPACLGGGPIAGVGILLSGAQVFDATDALGRDAVAHELLDRCEGHPERTGVYHYHDISACIDRIGTATGHAPLVGYAVDAYGIFGFAGENGRPVTNADLDECHGHTHTITWDGREVALYHYHATREFPYTLGCYRGSTRATSR